MNETLPQIQNQHQVFNGVEVSYGIAPILNTFSRLSTQSKRPYWSLFLINIETIIRDCKNTGSDQDIARKTLTDCTVLAQYISTYCRFSIPQNLKEKPVICFYFAHYENIPRLYLRDKLPKGTEERWEIRDRVEQIIRQEGFASGFGDTEILFISTGLKSGWPHRELINDLCKQLDTVRFRRVLMISHVPLDFHLYRIFGNNFNILESYTGAIKTQNQLGVKVFNNDWIPFTKYTHLLYGDKYYLKSLIPLVTKRQLKEVALKEHWTLLPEKAVLQSLIRCNPVKSDLYVKPDI